MELDECYHNLANAVVVRAIFDYGVAKRKLLRDPTDIKALWEMGEIMEFFMSDHLYLFTGVDSEVFLKRLSEL